MAGKNCWKCEHYDEDYQRCMLSRDHVCLERYTPEELPRIFPDQEEIDAGLAF